MMGEMGNFGSGMGLFGWLFMLLFWGLIIVAIIALVKWFNQSSGHSSGNRSLEIHKQRYARGEIDHAEFERKKQELEV